MNCKNCKMTDEYCASGDCSHDKTNYDILKEYEAHGVPVPSYDSWQKHKKVTAETQIKNCDLEIINKQLKELLKRAKIILEDEGDYMIVQEINEVLR